MGIEWTDMALAQLGDVMEYVSEQFGERVAFRVYEKIDAKVSDLEKFPHSGRYDGVNISDKFPLRHIMVVPNVLYYFVDTEYDKVVILACVHSKQSPQTVHAMLKQGLKQYQKKNQQD